MTAGAFLTIDFPGSAVNIDSNLFFMRGKCSENGRNIDLEIAASWSGTPPVCQNNEWEGTVDLTGFPSGLTTISISQTAHQDNGSTKPLQSRSWNKIL